VIAAPSLVIQPRERESPPHGGRQYGHFLALEVLQPAKNILLSQGTVTNESGGTISGFYGVYANSTISVVNDGVITGGTGRAYGCTPGGIMRHHAAWRDPSLRR
jgi:hypothetical protein